MTAKLKKDLEASMKKRTLEWLKTFEKSRTVLSNEEQDVKEKATKQEHEAFFKLIDECDEQDFILFVCYPILEDIKTKHSKNSRAGLPEFFKTLRKNLKATASYQKQDDEEEKVYGNTYDLFQERILEVQESPVLSSLLRKCYKDVQLTTLVTGYEDFMRIIS